MNRQTARALHEDHRANLDVLGRVEQAFSRLPRGKVPATGPGDEITLLVAALKRQIAQDVDRHFVFEETELFSRMVDSGDGGMAALLASEHDAIRDLAAELLPMLDAQAQGALDASGWTELVNGALELVERQVSHIQKEEMALLPLLEDLLDDETDGQLALAYASA